MLSYIYYEWKKYNLVLKCLDAIKDIADDHAFINKYYGFCCYYLGRYDEAVAYLKDALKQQPEYEKFSKYLEGLTYENKVKEIGDVDRAIQELEKMMMEKTPKLTEVTKLSMLYVFKGDSRKAEDLVVSYKNRLLAKAI
jgi:tetratricopeptide (TPR) repeat protein